MAAAGQLSAVIVIGLLLVALGVSIPVLKRIVQDGLERQRKLRAGEIERYTEDEVYDRGQNDAIDEDVQGCQNDAIDDDVRGCQTCQQCGAKNELGVTYCRRCVAPL